MKQYEADTSLEIVVLHFSFAFRKLPCTGMFVYVGVLWVTKRTVCMLCLKPIATLSWERLKTEEFIVALLRLDEKKSNTDGKEV